MTTGSVQMLVVDAYAKLRHCPTDPRATFGELLRTTAIAIPAIIIVGTVLEPMVRHAGLDPVHFGIISIAALAFGLITPPYGLCLLVSCAAVNVKVVNVLKDITIMLAPMLLVLLAIVLLPDLFLFLPRLVTEQGFK